MIEETTANGTVLFDIDAIDGDEPGTPNSDVTFDLSDSRLPFYVNPTTGVLTVEGMLSAGFYDIVVIAEDNGSPQIRSNASYIVEVFPPNLNSPEFQPPFDFAVIENFASNSTPVHTFSVTDADPANEGIVNLTLVASGYAENFRLEVNYPVPTGTVQGVLYLEMPVDRESVENFTIEVVAIDNANELFQRNSSQVFNVSVDDENDEDPYFIDGPYATNVGEDATNGTVFFQVAANDADIGINAELSFSLGVGSDFNGTFSIDESSGNVSVIGVLLKASRDFYQLVIVVTDLAGDPSGRTNETTLNVTIIEVNDNAPVFSPGTPTNRTIPENTYPGLLLVQFNVSDADTGVAMEYDLSLEQEASVFRLDNNTLVLNTNVDIEVSQASVITVSCDYQTN